MIAMTLTIRNEEPRDYETIKTILLQAFENHPHGGYHGEDRLVELLRKHHAMTVGFVAEKDGAVVGHIAISPVTIDGKNTHWFGLGPVAVRGDLQKQGIGSRLILSGLEALKQKNAAGCMLTGEPGYYNRFGFQSQDKLVLEGVPNEYFLVFSFNGEIPTGVVRFHSAFTDCLPSR